MSLSEFEPLELFLYAMRSDSTKSRYKSRLGNFFDFLELDGDLAEQSKQFIANSKKNGISWATANVMKFLSFGAACRTLIELLKDNNLRLIAVQKSLKAGH